MNDTEVQHKSLESGRHIYGLMGGAHSVEKWRDAGLVKQDRLHFTDTGYRLLGDLFVRALEADHDREEEGR